MIVLMIFVMLIIGYDDETTPLGAAQSSLASVERYDPKTNTWTNVSQMLCRRSLLNVAALEGKARSSVICSNALCVV